MRFKCFDEKRTCECDMTGRNYVELHELYLLIRRCQNGCSVRMLRNGGCLDGDCYEMLNIFVIVRDQSGQSEV